MVTRERHQPPSIAAGHYAPMCTDDLLSAIPPLFPLSLVRALAPIDTNKSCEHPPASEPMLYARPSTLGPVLVNIRTGKTPRASKLFLARPSPKLPKSTPYTWCAILCPLVPCIPRLSRNPAPPALPPLVHTRGIIRSNKSLPGALPLATKPRHGSDAARPVYRLLPPGRAEPTAFLSLPLRGSPCPSRYGRSCPRTTVECSHRIISPGNLWLLSKTRKDRRHPRAYGYRRRSRPYRCSARGSSPGRIHRILCRACRYLRRIAPRVMS